MKNLASKNKRKAAYAAFSNKKENAMFSKLEKIIGYQFQDTQLITEAMTHTSYANEHRVPKGKAVHNERLEFLGDSVLSLIITNHLFKNLSSKTEGEMSRIRSTIVCERSLREAADRIHLSEYILLGKGEEQTRGRSRDSIIADAMEALIGAIYLDSNFHEAEKFVLEHMKEIISHGMQGHLFKDYKTQYQELVQRHGESTIKYKILEEKGPDHKKTFVVALLLNDQMVAKGEGISKKEAEQFAAREAIRAHK